MFKCVITRHEWTRSKVILFISTRLCNTLLVRHTNRRVWVQISHVPYTGDCLRKGKHLCEWATTSLLETSQRGVGSCC